MKQINTDSHKSCQIAIIGIGNAITEEVFGKFEQSECTG